MFSIFSSFLYFHLFYIFIFSKFSSFLYFHLFYIFIFFIFSSFLYFHVFYIFIFSMFSSFLYFHLFYIFRCNARSQYGDQLSHKNCLPNDRWNHVTQFWFSIVWRAWFCIVWYSDCSIVCEAKREVSIYVSWYTTRLMQN